GRVIDVHLGIGETLGIRGTIIDAMLCQTHLDTYYEVLFDHLLKNSLDVISLDKNNLDVISLDKNNLDVISLDKNNQQ
ncbi:unnamed protein product, partial [Rotaria magnacalcarata]